MKSKKLIIAVIIAVIIVLIAGAFLWKGGSLGGGVGIGQPGLGIFSNKMTDEIYIKIGTEIVKNTYINNPGPGQTQETPENVLKNMLSKYGISEEEFGRYSQALAADKVRSAAIQEKMVQITVDLMKAKK